jgi:translocation and assembly module TamA
VRRALGFLAFLMAAACGPACGAPGLEYRVQVEAPRELANLLREGLNLVRWQKDPQMTPEQLRRLVDEALLEAREAAATEGYFSARVEARIDDSLQPWVVVLRVEPGERTSVGDVDIRFSGPAVDDPEARALLDRVRASWRLPKGQPFRQADWESAKREAARELASWRYAAARVAQSRAAIEPQAKSASLSVEIASGPPFRFGEVHVSGVKRYSDMLVQNMSTLRPGEVYTRDKLVAYQRRLLESGYFASVQAEIEARPELADAAPVRVAVIEASKHHVETGIGYSTDAGPRLELRYSNQDVLDRAWRFRSGLRLDQKIKNLQLDLDSPPQPGGRWNSFFGRARETNIQNESTRELAAGISHNWGPERTPTALIVSGHLEEQRVQGSVTDNRQALYFGHRRTFRRTDDLLSPRSGYLGSIELGGAPPPLASRQFLRGVGSASVFIPVGRNGNVLLRGQAGLVEAASREGIPTTFLFRTGGDQTVRGYAFESLGVKQGDAIVGGRRLAWGSAEYIHWMGESWGLAVFADAGNAWDSGIKFNPARGYGSGVRFRTPIGPIRADIAYGERTQQFRLHFSVGYNF